MANSPAVCCAYECLRIVNYLSHATLVDIQTLLILGNVLSNNMNAGVAWSLLGIPPPRISNAVFPILMINRTDY